MSQLVCLLIDNDTSQSVVKVQVPCLHLQLGSREPRPRTLPTLDGPQIP